MITSAMTEIAKERPSNRLFAISTQLYLIFHNTANNNDDDGSDGNTNGSNNNNNNNFVNTIITNNAVLIATTFRKMKIIIKHNGK